MILTIRHITDPVDTSHAADTADTVDSSHATDTFDTHITQLIL